VRTLLGYPDVQLVAICDVRESHRSRAKGIVDEHYEKKDCAIYSDFRELLARADIDAVLIAVPDHWHVLIGLEAARQGKHMYYEKPLSLSARQCKVIREAVKKSAVVFQFGTQQRSDNRFRLACELVRNGKIGQLSTIMIGSANYKQIPDQPEQPIPEGFDYDFWLGPAPWSPYTFERCTRNWTLMNDYSLGCVSGAWGIHHVDIAQWANDADGTVPTEIEGTGTIPADGFYDTAVEWEVEHRYANGVKLIHMDMPTALKRAEQFKLHWMGILFQGSEGWIYVCREFMDAEPKSLLKYKFSPNDKRLPLSVDHHRNFLDAVKTGARTIAPITGAYHSDLVCHHDDIAMRMGRKLYWDLEKEEFKNDPQANRLLTRPMRSPWHIE
jgi:predicted dehydrogenase